MKIVAFVPIKLNSVRLPNKNLLPLAGEPLCWHICNTLLQIKEIKDCYVYCSDEKVLDYIPNEVRFLKRNATLDGDLVKGFDIYTAFIKEVMADVYVLAHTTSPFVLPDTIRNSLHRILDGSHDSAFTAKKVQSFVWYKGSPLNYDINDVPRTQDMEAIYVETSGFYMFKQEIFTKHRRRIGFKPYIQEVSDTEAIDIDTQDEFDKAIFYSKLTRGETNE